MKKILLMLAGLLLSWNVNALEVAGVKLADKVQVGNETLQLNGAGLRTKWFFKVYVSALYLPQKQTSARCTCCVDSVARSCMELSARPLRPTRHRLS